MKNILRSFLLCGLSASMMLVNAQTVRTGVNFDGTDDLVIIPNNSAYNFGTGPFTVEAWIQADEAQAINPHILYKKDTATGATGITMAINNSGKLLIGIKGTAYSTGFGFGSPDITDGECHHVVFTRDVSGTDDTVRAYIDGSLVKKSVQAIPSADVTHTSAIYIGGSSGGFGPEDLTYKGLVKELRLWNNARTETEINATMDKFLKGNESGLVGNWRFYENTGTTVKDYSTTKNDGMFAAGAKAPAWAEFCDVINDTIPTGPGPIGIDEHLVDNVSHYPNPVSNQLSWKTNGRQMVNVKIYNALGKLVLEEADIQGNTIDVSSLKNGIYIYDMQLEGDKISRDWFIKE